MGASGLMLVCWREPRHYRAILAPSKRRWWHRLVFWRRPYWEWREAGVQYHFCRGGAYVYSWFFHDDPGPAQVVGEMAGIVGEVVRYEPAAPRSRTRRCWRSGRG